MKLTRYAKNPILSPLPGSDWQSTVTTNPGVWYDEAKREVVMLYRAAGHDAEHKVHLGLAVSKNGYDFERVSDRPVFSPSVDG
ncbi:MAG: glycosidase, partial [Opitutaceae bacterium]|nr:glycosidase [Opitutaceae bacterium]